MATSRKKSEVWDHFTEEHGTAYAICNTCHDKVKRGKDNERHAWSATPLWNHLKRHHADKFKAATEQRSAQEHTAKRRRLEEAERGNLYVNGTPKLAAFSERKTKYSADTDQQKEIVKLLAVSRNKWL